MKRTVLFATLALSIGLLPCAFAQVSTQGQKTLLRIKWVKGKTYKYTMGLQMEAGGKAANQAYGYNMDVLDVKNGSATVKVSATGDTKVADKPVTVTMDNRGKTTSQTKTGYADSLIVFPEKAVTPGQSWTGSQKVNFGAGDVATEYKYTFKGLSKLRGTPVANLDVAITMKGNNMSGSGKGQASIKVEDGMILLLTQDLDMVSKMTDSKGKTSTMHLPVHIIFNQRN